MRVMGGHLALVVCIGLVLVAGAPGPPGGTPGEFSATPTRFARGPILIEGNGDFTAANGVVSGSGTSTDPYVMSGWDISSASEHGIVMRNTTAYFVISDTAIHDGGSSFDGYRFVNVRNGRIENSSSTMNRIGMVLEQVDSFRLNGSLIQGSALDGVDVTQAIDFVAAGSIFENNGIGLRVEAGTGVDVDGNAIRGNNALGLGVVSSSDVRITRNNVSFNREGMILRDVARGDVSGNRMYQDGTGILSDFLVDTTIADNIVSTSGGTGIGITHGREVRVVGNNVTTTWAGVTSLFTTNLTISRTNVSGTPFWGMLLDTSWNVTLVDNDLGMANHGVYLTAIENATLRGNRFSGNGIVLEGSAPRHFGSHNISPDNVVDGLPIRSYRDCSGLVLDGVPSGQVFLANCTGMRLANLSLMDTDIGLHAAYVDGLEIEGSSFLGARWEGIVLRHVSNGALTSVRSGITQGRPLRAEYVRNVTLDGFLADQNTGEVGFYYPQDVVVANSTLSGNSGGLYAVYGTRIRVQNSSFVDNAYGVTYSEITDGEIRGNEIANNGLGVSLYQSSDIKVHANRFLGNNDQAADSGAANRWDDGYPSGGNFWSDYTGWDDCGGPEHDVCPGSDGLGDVPYAIDADSFDFYPRVYVNPPNVPPVANFTFDPASPVWGVLVGFSAEASYDPEGWPLVYDWDFGDGTVANDAGASVAHTYGQWGTYTVSLRVTDVRGATETETQILRVHALPVPSFTFVPGRPIVGDIVTFDAFASFDPDGSIVEYLWDFGGDTRLTGVTFTASYGSPGDYYVTLTVRDDSGFEMSEAQTVYVDPAPPRLVSLVPYSHPAGFSLPIPDGWTVLEDEVIENITIELILLGPVHNVQTNILVDTDADGTVRETASYLEGLVAEAVAGAQAGSPYLVEMTEGPTHRTIAGHASVTFKLQYGTTSLWQKVAIIVSEEHRRYWVLVLTADAFVYPVMDDAFERMLSGFEITLPANPPANPQGGIVLLFGVIAIAAAIAVIIAFLALVQSRPRVPVQPLAPPAGYPQTPVHFCPRCGAPVASGQNFCQRCGSQLPRLNIDGP